VPKATGIGITFTERIIAGSGNVTLRIAGAAGTVVENFGVGNSVTINNNQITIDPTSDLTAGDTYHISYPSGAFTNTGGDVSYVGTAYTFGAKPRFSELWVWGRNPDYGQAGTNTRNISYSSPIQIPGTNWDSGSRTDEMSAAVKTDGTYWIWGANIFGSLGLNQTHNQQHRSSPVQLPGTTWSIGGTLGYRNAFGIKSDNTLWVWGNNGQGELGVNDRTNYSSPVQIPGTTWDMLGPIYSGATWGVKTDGTLWVWGQQSYGEFGQNGNVTTNYSSPKQIPGTTWTNKIGGGSAQQMFVVKTDGTLWSWGNNPGGMLGHNNQTKYSSPVQIPGTTWKDIKSVAYAITATKTDGTLWAWGYNTYGGLGQNDRNRRSSPVQIPGTTWDTPFALGRESFGATKTDGTLWTWGQSNSGCLGQNQPGLAHRSSPVQIPGTTWEVTNMTRHMFGNSSGGGFAKKVT